MIGTMNFVVYTKELDRRRLRQWLGRSVKVGLVVLATAFLMGFSYQATVVGNFPGEVVMSEWVQTWRSPWLDHVMKSLSMTIHEFSVVAIVLFTSLFFYVKGMRDYAVLIVGASVVGFLFRTVIKFVVDRPRPSSELVQVIEQTDSSSFPSGHVMFSAIFLTTLTFVLLRQVVSPVARWFIVGASVAAMGLVGLSRIYLGVHWLGDVLAGYAFSAVIVVGSICLWRRWAESKSS